MKKYFAIALASATLMAGAPTFVLAGGKECPMCECKMDAGKKTDELALALDLNDKQKGLVKDLLDAKEKKIKPAVEQLEATHKQAKDEFETGLKRILNKAQLKKFDAWKDAKDK